MLGLIKFMDSQITETTISNRQVSFFYRVIIINNFKPLQKEIKSTI